MGSEVGPLNQDELIDMVRHHKLNPEDLVRRGNSSWVPAFDVKGLFAAAAKPPKRKTSEPQATAAATEESSAPTPAAKPIEKTTPIVSGSGNRIADWYCIASGEKQGPIGLGELRSLFQEGRLRQTDRVWRSSSPKFRKANEIEDLLSGENN